MPVEFQVLPVGISIIDVDVGVLGTDDVFLLVEERTFHDFLRVRPLLDLATGEFLLAIQAQAAKLKL